MISDKRDIFSKQRLDSLWRFASSVLTDREEAKDVVQDVMMRVCMSPLPVLNVDAYLVRAVRNACIDRLRAQERVRDSMPDEISEGNADNYDEKDIVRYAMSELNAKQRMAVHLKDIEGYESDEVARMMGINENHLRTLLSRARKAMRDIIEKELDNGIRVR